MQRKKGNKRLANAEEKAFQAWLKNRPCCVSGRHGVEVHHMYGSSFTHNKILVGHLACIPLHPDFHRGEHGIHTIGKNAWVGIHGAQASLFEKQVYDYGVETGLELPFNEIQAIMDWGR